MTEGIDYMDDQESVECGYIKAKFPLVPGKSLFEHASYQWAEEVTRPRVTTNFIYVAFGHSTIRDNGHARALLEQIASLGGKVTRLDFCVDYLGKLDFDAFYKLHNNGRQPQPSMVKSPTGKTVYVGRRASARLLRTYDKRAEILYRDKVDVGFDITRFELEVKRNMVARYKVLFLTGRTDLILSDIQVLYGLRGFCDVHEPTRPVAVREKKSSCFAFVARFRRVIGEAYHTDLAQFLDIIGDM